MNNNNMNINKILLKGLNPNSKLLKEYKNSLLNLSKEQKEASIGLMLGDASLQTQNKGKTFRIKFEWGEKQKPYLDHVYNLFEEWVISEPHKKSRLSPNKNIVTNFGFQTISHEAFNFLAELFFYKGKEKKFSEQRNIKKSVSDLLIKEQLTERGLAYWFMDDGGKLDYNLNSKNKSIVLNTQSFTELEVMKMATELNAKFRFETEIRSNKGKSIIVLKSNSYFIFKELIEPYILPEMKYKLP